MSRRGDQVDFKETLRGLCAPAFQVALTRHGRSLIDEANARLGTNDFVAGPVVAAQQVRVESTNAGARELAAVGFIESWCTVTDLWVACTLAQRWLTSPGHIGHVPERAATVTKPNGSYLFEAVVAVVVVACEAAQMDDRAVGRLADAMRARHGWARRPGARDEPAPPLPVSIETLCGHLDAVNQGDDAGPRLIDFLYTLNELTGDTVANFAPMTSINNNLFPKNSKRHSVPMDAPTRQLWLGVLDAFFNGLGFPAGLLADFPNEPILMPVPEDDRPVDGPSVSKAAEQWRTAFVEALEAVPRLKYLARDIPLLDRVTVGSLHVSPPANVVRPRDLEGDVVEAVLTATGRDTIAIEAWFDQARESLELRESDPEEVRAQIGMQLERIRDVCLGGAEPPDLGAAPLNIRATAVILLGDVIEER